MFIVCSFKRILVPRKTGRLDVYLQSVIRVCKDDWPLIEYDFRGGSSSIKFFLVNVRTLIIANLLSWKPFWGCELKKVDSSLIISSDAMKTFESMTVALQIAPTLMSRLLSDKSLNAEALLIRRRPQNGKRSNSEKACYSISMCSVSALSFVEKIRES